MRPTDLETHVDRALRQLPLPRAPHTLLPRVLAAVQEWTLRPWYERAWFTWPLGWQVVSAASLIMLIVGGGMLLPTAEAAADGAMSTLAAGMISDVVGVWQRVEVTANTARILWATLVEPLVPYAFALVVLMCLACAALGTALNHVVLARALPR